MSGTPELKHKGSNFKVIQGGSGRAWLLFLCSLFSIISAVLCTHYSFWNHKAKFLYFIFRKLITVWLMYTTNKFSPIRDTLFYFRGNLIFTYLLNWNIHLLILASCSLPPFGTTCLFFSRTFLFVIVSFAELKVTHSVLHFM